ncbi:OmpA/MotB family protein [Desulfonatronum thiodismutans]|uniref:OmpA/MotB family protein n=1 Tax=Desulfonatronum thiodismutans TaxID=159290 RepID=UPI0004ABEADD|nr:flagellar motor protein MotB [Desulfonatronum thiodismutans]
MPRNNAPPQEEEGAPLWMVTFADLMSLLLTFFILVLSFANMDIVRFREMLGSIQTAFGVQVQRREADYVAFSPSEFERKDLELSRQNEEVLSMVVQLRTIMQDDEALQKSSGVEADDEGLVLRVDSESMFDVGSAELKPEAVPALEAAIKILRDYNMNLVIRGHTDNTPVRTAQFPSNWELSSARATAALRYILEHGGFSPTRMRAVGYADSQPLVPNNSEDNRRRNRRVEFYYHSPDAQSW